MLGTLVDSPLVTDPPLATDPPLVTDPLLDARRGLAVVASYDQEGSLWRHSNLCSLF